MSSVKLYNAWKVSSNRLQQQFLVNFDNTNHYSTASRRHNVNFELTLYSHWIVKFRFNAINQSDIHSLYFVLLSRTCLQKMVRGYIIAEPIRKRCRGSLETLHSAQRASETIFWEIRLCRKTRTSRILSVSVMLRSCDSVHFHDYEMSNALTRCF